MFFNTFEQDWLFLALSWLISAQLGPIGSNWAYFGIILANLGPIGFVSHFFGLILALILAHLQGVLALPGVCFP